MEGEARKKRTACRLRPALILCYLTVPFVAYVAYVVASLLQLLPCTSFEIVQLDVGGLCSELVHVRLLARVSSSSRVTAHLAPLMLDIADRYSPEVPIARIRVPAQTVHHGLQLWELEALVEVIDAAAVGALISSASGTPQLAALPAAGAYEVDAGESSARATNGTSSGAGSGADASAGAGAGRGDDGTSNGERRRFESIALALHGRISTGAFLGLPFSLPFSRAFALNVTRMRSAVPTADAKEAAEQRREARERRCGCAEQLSVGALGVGDVTKAYRVHWASPERLHVSVTLRATMAAGGISGSFPALSLELLTPTAPSAVQRSAAPGAPGGRGASSPAPSSPPAHAGVPAPLQLLGAQAEAGVAVGAEATLLPIAQVSVRPCHYERRSRPLGSARAAVAATNASQSASMTAPAAEEGGRRARGRSRARADTQPAASSGTARGREQQQQPGGHAGREEHGGLAEAEEAAMAEVVVDIVLVRLRRFLACPALGLPPSIPHPPGVLS